jgi:hypothetical protein
MNLERFMSLTYGFSTSEWDTARSWVRNRLRKVASERTSITYSDLCRELARATGVRLEPDGSPLAALLGQVNVLEREENKPLISCLVVHATGEMQPGVGFWNMAKAMDLDVGDTAEQRERFWVAELTCCYETSAG